MSYGELKQGSPGKMKDHTHRPSSTVEGWEYSGPITTGFYVISKEMSCQYWKANVGVCVLVGEKKIDYWLGAAKRRLSKNRHNSKHVASILYRTERVIFSLRHEFDPPSEAALRKQGIAITLQFSGIRLKKCDFPTSYIYCRIIHFNEF